MPPQVEKAGAGAGTVIHQPPSGVKEAPPRNAEAKPVDAKKDPEDPRAAARATQGSKPTQDREVAEKNAQVAKQHAIDKMNHSRMQGQLTQKNLQDQIPATNYTPLEYRPMGPKTEDRKPGVARPDQTSVGEGTTANARSARKPEKHGGSAGQHKLASEKPKTQSAGPGGLLESARKVAHLAHDAAGVVAQVVGDSVAAAAEDANKAVLLDRVGELIQRPQSLQVAKIPGKLFEVEFIKPSDVNGTGTEERSRHNPPVVGDVVQHDRHTINTRTATQAGLAERLTNLTGGKPLTPFEQKMVDEWKTPSKWGGTKVLVPIMGSNEKDKGVQAYKLQEGSSGHTVTTYFDRQGNQLTRVHDELEATDGLNPVEWAAARWAAGRSARGTARSGTAAKPEPEPANPNPSAEVRTGSTIPGHEPPISSLPPRVQPGRKPTIKSQAPPPPSEPAPGRVGPPPGNAPMSGKPTGGTQPESQPPAPAPNAAGRGKTLPGSLRRPGGPFDPRRPQVPERPLPKNFPKGSGTALTPEQVRQAHDVRKVGWSMTREEHARQWKQANPTSTEPPPVSFTTRDGRVQVDEARWIESGQPPLWGNRAGDQVSSPPPPPSNNE